MAERSADVYNHLVALRTSLYENRWMGRLEGPLLSVFNELLASARSLAPNDRVLRAIKPNPVVSAAALVVLVDQMLVALERSAQTSSHSLLRAAAANEALGYPP